MDSIPNWAFLVVAGGAGLYGLYAFVPSIWGYVKAAFSKIAGGTAKSASDNRADLSSALCLLADRVAQVKCEKLKFQGDEACRMLSEIVIRPLDYQIPAQADVKAKVSA